MSVLPSNLPPSVQISQGLILEGALHLTFHSQYEHLPLIFEMNGGRWKVVEGKASTFHRGGCSQRWKVGS